MPDLTPEERLDWAVERADPDAVKWNGCDAAIIGVADGRIVYSRDALVDVFIAQEMTEEEADEWVSFNIEGAYVGEFTPFIVQLMPAIDSREALD